LRTPDLDDKLRHNLSNISLCADFKFTLFLDTFIDVINTHTSLVKLSRKKTKLTSKSKPWITKSIVKSIKAKKRLFRKKSKHHNNIEYLQTH